MRAEQCSIAFRDVDHAEDDIAILHDPLVPHIIAVVVRHVIDDDLLSIDAVRQRIDPPRRAVAANACIVAGDMPSHIPPIVSSITSIVTNIAAIVARVASIVARIAAVA